MTRKLFLVLDTDVRAGVQNEDVEKTAATELGFPQWIHVYNLEAWSQRSNFAVRLHVYDLGSFSKWALEALATAGGGTFGAFHCGLELLNVEFSFALPPSLWRRLGIFGIGVHDKELSGICWHNPKKNDSHVYRESITMGKSPLGFKEVLTLLGQLEKAWPANSYDILSRNCNHFAEDLCSKLRLPTPFPTWVHGVAKDLAPYSHCLTCHCQPLEHGSKSEWVSPAGILWDAGEEVPIDVFSTSSSGSDIDGPYSMPMVKAL